jgi:hypothetical protein
MVNQIYLYRYKKLIGAGGRYLTLEKYYMKSVGVYVLHIP